MSTVTVTAPADLSEGYTFDATAEGKTFKVTVPEGGVKAGQEIEVPFPTIEEPMSVEAGGPSGAGAPQGAWRNDLCDCCEVCPVPFLMGWCCSGVMAGQVFQRLKYNFIGMPATGDEYNSTCMIMTGIFFFAWLLSIILAAATGVGVVAWYAFYLYIIVALTLARNNFRKKYNIPAKHCGESCLDDCCCAYWCGCCTIIQMHRHTHDENVYPYEFSSKTGLPETAPMIV